MATITFRANPSGESKHPGVNTILWETLTSANAVGSAYESAGVDRSFQLVGTPDGATLVAQGSNDGSTWVTLQDPEGNDLSFTAAGLKQVLEFTKYIRPSIASGATANTDLDVYMVEHGG